MWSSFKNDTLASCTGKVNISHDQAQAASFGDALVKAWISAPLVSAFTRVCALWGRDIRA
jgi:hypothetical protein